MIAGRLHWITANDFQYLLSRFFLRHDRGCHAGSIAGGRDESRYGHSFRPGDDRRLEARRHEVVTVGTGRIGRRVAFASPFLSRLEGPWALSGSEPPATSRPAPDRRSQRTGASDSVPVSDQVV